MQKRYIANITLESLTPLKVGSADSDFMKDSPIQKDWNGLPMILGTSIAGVLRKEFDGEVHEIFGKENGSKVIFSNALLVDESGFVNEGLLLEKSTFLKLFDKLPQREHTAINDKGVAKEHSKFDEEVVYGGARFKFSIEMLDEKEAFEELLALIQSPSFRLGGGTTKGFGRFKVVAIEQKNITNIEEMVAYNSSLNSFNGEVVNLEEVKSMHYHKYTLNLTPDDFFMFGSGFGDDDADMTPVYEQLIDYETKGLSAKKILIPASSIKGALSHRVAYLYNKEIGATIESGEAKVEENNEAVKALFGHKKEMVEGEELGLKGSLLMSDCYQKNKNETKVFDHVAIDRFTGGGLDGALFQEKTVAQKDEWQIELLLNKEVDEPFVAIFEKSLDDVCSGMLALGGATTKGHGAFSGTWSKS